MKNIFLVLSILVFVISCGNAIDPNSLSGSIIRNADIDIITSGIEGDLSITPPIVIEDALQTSQNTAEKSGTIDNVEVSEAIRDAILSALTENPIDNIDNDDITVTTFIEDGNITSTLTLNASSGFVFENGETEINISLTMTASSGGGGNPPPTVNFVTSNEDTFTASANPVGNGGGTTIRLIGITPDPDFDIEIRRDVSTELDDQSVRSAIGNAFNNATMANYFVGLSGIDIGEEVVNKGNGTATVEVTYRAKEGYVFSQNNNNESTYTFDVIVKPASGFTFGF